MASRIGLPLLLPAMALLAAVLSLRAPGAAAASSSSPGLVFHVGGPRGWRVPDANTSYGWWAMENRFHVGDELCELLAALLRDFSFHVPCLRLTSSSLTAYVFV
jgi:uncharacterized membrane protein